MSFSVIVPSSTLKAGITPSSRRGLGWIHLDKARPANRGLGATRRRARCRAQPVRAEHHAARQRFLPTPMPPLKPPYLA